MLRASGATGRRLLARRVLPAPVTSTVGGICSGASGAPLPSVAPLAVAPAVAVPAPTPHVESEVLAAIAWTAGGLGGDPSDDDRWLGEVDAR